MEMPLDQFSEIAGQRPMTRQLLTLLLIAVAAVQGGCVGESASETAADDEERVSESFGLVTLSPQAQELIGLTVEPVRKKSLPDVIRASGWLLTEPGKQVTIKAPSAGFFLPVGEGAAPEVGAQISSIQQLGNLKVFLSPQEEAQLVIAKEEADILMKQSQVTLQLAEEQLERLQKTPEGTVARTRLLELKETVERAKVAYKEAQEKLPFLPKEPYGANLEFKELAIDSPLSGRIVSQEAAAGQFVTQGDPLWTVADWSMLWIQIPLFAGDIPRVLAGEEIQITVPGIPTSFTARPVDVTRPAEPGRRTIDLVYEIENGSGLLRAGQPVEVELPTQQIIEQPVVPRSALIWDGFGNAWVYVRVNETSFRRQQVELGQQDAGFFAVKRGLKEEQRIVTLGAEALYGEEFKGQIPLEDDD